MTLSDDADFPDCPRCGSNVLVSRTPSNTIDWKCHACGETYDDQEMTRRVFTDGGTTVDGDVPDNLGSAINMLRRQNYHGVAEWLEDLQGDGGDSGR